MEMEPNSGLLLKQINDALERNVNNNVKDMDLTLAQTRVLILLDHQENKTASMKELEHSLGVAQSTCAGIVSRLAAKGLITTYSAKEDRRSKLVTLTEDGKNRCAASKAEAESADDQLLRNFSPEEKDELNRLLKKLLSNLK